MTYTLRFLHAVRLALVPFATVIRGAPVFILSFMQPSRMVCEKDARLKVQHPGELMKIQCDCGSFQAELFHFPENSPGRLVCYCDDCQTFLTKIHREEVLDPYGGTEVIPVYPSDLKFIKGKENLICNRLSEKGLYRWSTTCCNSPMANTRPGFPWVGIYHSAYTRENPGYLENLGPVKSRIMGKYAKGRPPFKIPEKMDLHAIITVLPFLLKGFLFGKHRDSPFFAGDGVTPVSKVHALWE